MTIAVALALYNGEKFIVKQMESLRQQTRQADHVVFCDDGSTDKTVEIVRDYIEKNKLASSWEIYENATNLGYIKNFYAAISHCKEDLIFLCDQDDLWETEKIQKMSQIMEQRQDIKLLSCKYDIINGEDDAIHSVMHKTEKEDESLTKISVRDIMQAYRWPGMVMCISREFFEKIYPEISKEAIPHDLAFAVSAADQDAFYEYNYIGAYHRRHEHNTAKEEHRIFKILNMERKISDIDDTCNFLKSIVDAKLSISQNSYEMIQYKLNHLMMRKEQLRKKSLIGIIKVYQDNKYKILRTASFIGDLWLVLFGNVGEKDAN